MIDAIPSNGAAPRPVPSRDAALWEAAQQLEATFLAEMLKSTGLGEVSDTFGGGVGEEQFASFLRQSQAEQITVSGGIGLAESIFNSLKESRDAAV